MQLRSESLHHARQSRVFKTSLQSNFPSASASLNPGVKPYQSLPHLHLLWVNIPQFPFPIYGNPTQLLKCCLLNLNVQIKTLKCLKKSCSQHSHPRDSHSVRLEWSPRGMEHFLKLFTQLWVRHWKPTALSFLPHSLSLLQHSALMAPPLPWPFALRTCVPLCMVAGAVVQGLYRARTRLSSPLCPCPKFHA